ncbi:MAG: gluconokinase [Enterobacterales bacterium endosymbiont of Blomia tropicalis]|uniref:gluconokinase n=1 Tax=Mixta mediterraneensis TaxID=2758443 RepID=UPI0025A83545|nr:gluconokinase [Mixta mediterraneensis]MDL4914521.1 gluconokinase [Mixta mediterraneensis]
MAGQCIIVMGVSGTGKSSVGMALANAMNAKFIDGDDLHPRHNIVKMGSGQALNDDDRLPWLERLSDVIFSLEQKSETSVLVCSALKRRYREQLRTGSQNLRFIWLNGDYACVLERMKRRQGHFMPEALLQSQFAALEAPGLEESDVIPVNIAPSLKQIVEHCVSVLQAEAELPARLAS